MPEQECSECDYWIADDRNTESGGFSATGECHFNPPTPIVEPYEAARTKTKEQVTKWRLRSKWPVTSGLDWCSRFKARK